MVSARTGLSIRQFNEHTPIEVAELVKEHHEVDYERYKQHATLHRLFTTFIINVNLKSGSQITDPRRLITFPWESHMNEDMMEDLLNTDWEALDKKYNNLVPYQRPKKESLN